MNSLKHIYSLFLTIFQVLFALQADTELIKKEFLLNMHFKMIKSHFHDMN